MPDPMPTDLDQALAELALRTVERDEARRALGDLATAAELTARGLDAARLQALDEGSEHQALLADVRGTRAPLRIVGIPADTTNTTGAADGPAAPEAEADDRKESTAMHTLSSEDTRQGRQFTAAFALAHLLELELPAPGSIPEWRITAEGHLFGHITLSGRDADARGALMDWATFLNARIESVPGRNGHREWTHLSVAGLYRSTPVAIWTHVAVRPLPLGEVQS